jgi:hypothetical protein
MRWGWVDRSTGVPGLSRHTWSRLRAWQPAAGPAAPAVAGAPTGPQSEGAGQPLPSPDDGENCPLEKTTLDLLTKTADYLAS